MSLTKASSRLLLTLLSIAIAAHPDICEAKAFAGELIVVPADKLPRQAHQQGQGMVLRLVNPTTLYLYVEQENGLQIAIFDVSYPQKIKFKGLAKLDAPASFDFVQPAGQSLEMIRYRDGRGIAVLDLSKPRSPVLKAVGAAAAGYYIVPVGDNPDVGKASTVPHDYQIIEPLTSKSVVTVKAVVEQQTDELNGTTYLLGANGLTVIRNIRIERELAASTPAWTNTIDDQ